MVTDDENHNDEMLHLVKDEADSSEEFPTNEQLGLVVRRVLAT